MTVELFRFLLAYCITIDLLIESILYLTKSSKNTIFETIIQ